MKNVNLLIGPVSFYKNGELLPHIAEACTKYAVPVLNYMSSREYLIANAALTAEGLLSLLISNTPFALFRSKALILGFGRCGKALADRLHGIGCIVTAYDLMPEEIENAQNYDIVINTIPAKVITEKYLTEFRADCIFFDIAATPGGFDEDAIHKLGLKLFHCPAIPGQMSPMSAGYAIGKEALSYLN